MSDPNGKQTEISLKAHSDSDQRRVAQVDTKKDDADDDDDRLDPN